MQLSEIHGLQVFTRNNIRSGRLSQHQRTPNVTIKETRVLFAMRYIYPAALIPACSSLIIGTLTSSILLALTLLCRQTSQKKLKKILLIGRKEARLCWAGFTAWDVAHVMEVPPNFKMLLLLLVVFSCNTTVSVGEVRKGKKREPTIAWHLNCRIESAAFLLAKDWKAFVGSTVFGRASISNYSHYWLGMETKIAKNRRRRKNESRDKCGKKRSISVLTS